MQKPIFLLICSIAWPSVAEVSMASPVYTVSEGNTVEVCVELTSLPADGLQWEIVVTLDVVDGIKAGMYAKTHSMLDYCHCCFYHHAWCITCGFVFSSCA